jgi:hypothetical protein
LAGDPAPSPAALALALEMRAFDATLSDAQVDAIARGIDEARAHGAELSPTKKRLRNAIEPITAVRIASENG